MPKKSHSSQKTASKSRVSLTQVSSFMRSNIRLIAGILLMIISGLVVTPFMTVNPLAPESFSGLDVLHDCQKNPEVFVSINFKDEKRAKVSVLIENWEEIGDSCSTLRIHVPGKIDLPLYGREIESLPSNQVTSTPEPSQLPDAYALPVGFGDNLKFIHNYRGFGEDILEFHPKDLNGFIGEVEFTWVDMLKTLDYSSSGIYIPIQAIQDAGDTLKPTEVFTFSVLSPAGWLFDRSTPESFGVQSNVSIQSLLFKIDATKTDLAIWYTNSAHQKNQNFILFVFTAMFGIGITLVFEELIMRLKKK